MTSVQRIKRKHKHDSSIYRNIFPQILSIFCEIWWVIGHFSTQYFKLYFWPHLMGGGLSQYTNLPSFWVWMLQFILSKLRCAHRIASLPSALRKQRLTLTCEWHGTLLFLTYILAPAFTIHKRRSSGCRLKWKLHLHFLSTRQIFLGLIPVLLCWGERVNPHPWSPAAQALLDQRNRSWVWFQLGCG